MDNLFHLMSESNIKCIIKMSDVVTIVDIIKKEQEKREMEKEH